MNNIKAVKKVPVESCQLFRKRDDEDGVFTSPFLPSSFLISFQVSLKYRT